MIYKKIKKYTAGIMAVVSIFGCTLAQTIPIKAEEKWPEGPQINSPCAIVMEVNTGTVLYEKNSHEVHYPASITKILTTLLAIENSNLEDIVTFFRILYEFLCQHTGVYHLHNRLTCIRNMVNSKGRKNRKILAVIL